MRRIVSVVLVAAAISSFFFYRAGTAFEDLDNRFDPTTISAAFDPADRTAIYNSTEVLFPEELLALDVPKTPTPVLGDTDVEKHIEVDLTTQTLTAYEGGAAVFSYPISSGKWGKTPTGTFTIWSKFRYTKMEGGSKARRTYYYLPNVPYVLFFANETVAAHRGFAIHGAYWHDNFGVPMSHGCVNMRPRDAGVVYEWAAPELPEGKRSILSSQDNPGTTVVITGEAPQG